MSLYAAPSPPAPVFRVARGDAGPPSDPFAPPGWERAGADGAFGNRFEVPSKVDDRPDEARFRMIYAATQREAAFAETIAPFRPDLPALAALRTIHGGASEPQPLTDVVPMRWQQLRGIGRLLLDSALRFVDVAHPDTLAEMRATFARLAVDRGHRDIDVSTVTSGDRRLTQRIARAVYERPDATGVPIYSGIRYLSRHGATWECWALFADRLVGEQLPVQAVRADDVGLIAAARHLGLMIHLD